MGTKQLFDNYYVWTNFKSKYIFCNYIETHLTLVLT